MKSPSHSSTLSQSNEETDSYILVGQANLRKQPQAAVELVQYINSAMRYYEFNMSTGVLSDTRRSLRRKSKRQMEKLRQEDSIREGSLEEQVNSVQPPVGLGKRYGASAVAQQLAQERGAQPRAESPPRGGGFSPPHGSQLNMDGNIELPNETLQDDITVEETQGNNSNRVNISSQQSENGKHRRTGGCLRPTPRANSRYTQSSSPAAAQKRESGDGWRSRK